VQCLGNARFLLQLSTIQFKFPLWAISLFDEKDVHLKGKHCPIHPLKVNKVQAAEHLLHSSSFLQKFHLSGYEAWQKFSNVLEEATSFVPTIKMEEPTTSNFMVENKGMINLYQSKWYHNQVDSYTVVRTSTITQRLRIPQTSLP
jgi:hypothetical protein